MELTLKKDAIIEEIKVCQKLIDDRECKLEEVNQNLRYMTDRIAVLTALDEKLTGTPKMLNREDLNDLTAKRFKLAPIVLKYENEISNMQANVKALHELLDQ